MPKTGNIIQASRLNCYKTFGGELTKFRVTEYRVSSPKLKGRACAAVIADMHGFSYGRGNRRLLEEVRKLKPHAIFIPGDMLVSKPCICRVVGKENLVQPFFLGWEVVRQVALLQRDQN